MNKQWQSNVLKFEPKSKENKKTSETINDSKEKFKWIMELNWERIINFPRKKADFQENEIYDFFTWGRGESIIERFSK